MKIEYSRLHGREAEVKRSVGSCYLIEEVICLWFSGTTIRARFEYRFYSAGRNCHGCPGPQDSGCSD